MRRTTVLGLAVSLAFACHDEPVSPLARTGESSSALPEGSTARSASFPACTKHWKNSISGIWSFGVNWNPAGVPGPNDVVCIDAVGTFTVTVFAPPVVEALIIGGRSADPTLLYAALNGQTWTVPTGIDVLTGTLAIDSSVTIDAGYIAVSGTLRVNASAGGMKIHVDSLANFGLVEFHAPNTSVIARGPVGVRNTGTMVCENAMSWGLVGSSEWRMEGGTLTGNEYMLIFTWAIGSSPVVFHWSGGTIPLNGFSPRLLTLGVNLRLLNTALNGAVQTFAAPHVTGDIGPDVKVWVEARGLIVGPRLPTILRSRSGGPLTNEGTLIVGSLYPTTVSGPGLVNLGQVEFEDASLTMDSLVNWGTMTVSGGSDMTSDASFIRNHGTLDVSWFPSLLSMVGADFISEAGSAQTGPLTLNGATLSGAGAVGELTVLGGKIEPGGAGGIGTLTAASVTLDAGSSLGIDLAGTAARSFDVLAVTDTVEYDGLLELREQVPFVGGICGQVLPIITDGSGGAPRKKFSSITGLVPAPSRGWRVYNPAGSFQLVGHDPSLPVSRAAATLALSEGGPEQSYNVCLRGAPTAQVTVTPGSAGGQLALPPSLVFAPFAFGAKNWALPQAVTVSAVDDLLFEPPPQIATITHIVTSTDPAYNFARLSSVAVTITDNDGSTDLGVEIQSAAPSANVGQTFTITIRDFNFGPDISVGATLTVPASAGFVYQSSSGVLSCSYDAVIGTTCQLPGSASGTFFDFTVTFEAVLAGSYPTSFTLSTIQTDPNVSNNSRTQTITIN